MPKAEIERRVQRAAQMLHLEPLLKRKPAQLSGGQRQRVAIGRALVREAGVFLFDEPLSNLDAKLRAELRRELKLLHKNLRSTMIYVTHDQVEAMTLATRIVVMYAGRIQQIGVPSEVYEKPENLFVAGFLGSPAMNFLHGQLKPTADSILFESQGLTLDVTPYGWRAPASTTLEVVLGIRPENLRIHADGQFQATVSLIEPMGNHHVVWLEFGGKLLSSVVSGPLTVGVDDAVRFGLDADRISLFDRVTEQRL
jgi:multiple sugar transport system ATP-binding protein